MNQPTPRVIKKSDPRLVEIEWSDGLRTRYTARELRQLCPCARCVNEVTGEPILDPSTVAEDVTQADLALVGHYAITMRFSDGHHTGIFTFPFLRANDPGAHPSTAAGA